MAVSGAGARRKGHAFERWFAQVWRVFDPTCKRNMSESQQAGHDIITNTPFGFQLKRWSNWRGNPNQVLKQAKDACSQLQIPVAVVKTDRDEPVVCMYLDDWMELVALTPIRGRSDDEQHTTRQ